MRRGEIWWADLPEPWGRRPVVLLARHSAYQILSWISVAPVTRRIRDLASEVVLDPEVDGVATVSVVNLDGIQTIRREWLTGYVTRLSAERMGEIDQAILFALGIGQPP